MINDASSGRKRKADSTSYVVPNQKGRQIDALVAQLFGTDSTAAPSAQKLGLEIRASPADSGNYGVYATTPLEANALIGGKESGIPTSAMMDPLIILKCHPIAQHVLQIDGTTQSFAFWFTLAFMAKALEDHGTIADEFNMKLATDNKYDFAKFDVYMKSLPRDSPEPCSWTELERAPLKGTQLAKQVDNQLRLLREEYDKVWKSLARESSGIDSKYLPPFDVNGKGSAPSLLWARGCHLSRSFPRSLVDAANLPISARTCSRSSSSSGSDEKPMLQVRLGDYQVPRITYSGPEESAPSSTNPTSNCEVDPNTIAGNLGVMFPFWDMLDHKPGHPVIWEGGNGYVRFRTVEPVAAGEPILNNYGPKGNQELLFTYGFSIENNPLDSVDGIVIGSRLPSEDGCQEVALHKARLGYLTEHDIPHKEENGALLIGPFSLYKAKPKSIHDTVADDDVEGTTGVIPQELLFALSVIGMDEEGLGVDIDEIDMLKQVFNRRLETLGDSIAIANKFSLAGFCESYKDGQRSLLRRGISELDGIMQGMDIGEEEEELIA